ncbi:fluoride efflux transporter CrcB [Solibacillus sp. CAU 1738]|uniref:fluoride efflux transporter CrcB n=1 Tax=Solibacillus sp. CAU 1738 TaxID=3140363 RepID=UPI0032606166
MILVAIGGFFGAIVRYFISSLLRIQTFPIATFIINITGSILFGIVVGLDVSKTWYYLLATGLLGAFTTFSTFSFETIQLFEKRQYFKAVFYVISTSSIAIFGVWFGYLLAL